MESVSVSVRVNTGAADNANRAFGNAHLASIFGGMKKNYLDGDVCK